MCTKKSSIFASKKTTAIFSYRFSSQLSKTAKLNNQQTNQNGSRISCIQGQARWASRTFRWNGSRYVRIILFDEIEASHSWIPWLSKCHPSVGACFSGDLKCSVATLQITYFFEWKQHLWQRFIPCWFMALRYFVTANRFLFKVVCHADALFAVYSHVSTLCLSSP